MALRALRKAGLSEYLAWLKGWINKGNRPTNHYSYRWSIVSYQFLTATSDFRLNGECGSLARRIIVLPGVKLLGGDMGHNTLYFMEDYSLKGLRYVPTYRDANESSRYDERAASAGSRSDSTRSSSRSRSGDGFSLGTAAAVTAFTGDPYAGIMAGLLGDDGDDD